VASPLSHQFVQIDGDRIVQVRRINRRGIRGGVRAAVADEAGCCAGARSEAIHWKQRQNRGFRAIAGGSVESDGVSWRADSRSRYRQHRWQGRQPGQDFQKSNRGSLVPWRGRRAQRRCGLTLSLFDAETHFGMRDQAVGFEDSEIFCSACTSVKPATCKRTGTRGCDGSRLP